MIFFYATKRNDSIKLKASQRNKMEKQSKSFDAEALFIDDVLSISSFLILQY